MEGLRSQLDAAAQYAEQIAERIRNALDFSATPNISAGGSNAQPQRQSSLSQIRPRPAARTSRPMNPALPSSWAAHHPVVPRAALGALHLGSEPRNQRVTRIARHVDHGLVPARIIQAIGDQVVHALPAHVGQVHRRAGWVADLHHGGYCFPLIVVTSMKIGG